MKLGSECENGIPEYGVEAQFRSRGRRCVGFFVFVGLKEKASRRVARGAVRRSDETAVPILQ